LNLEECLIFWRQGFAKITDDTFNKEYRYNVRHAYGDVGGDSNRRGNGYSPFSCQKILTEHPPGPGEAHGCPYRHFSVDNLTNLLQAVGVNDQTVLRGVKEDKEKMKFHLACNRYVERSKTLPASHSSFQSTSLLTLDTESLNTPTRAKSKRLKKTARGARPSWKRLCIRMSISRGVIC
jgi:DNA primase large subunit